MRRAAIKRNRVACQLIAGRRAWRKCGNEAALPRIGARSEAKLMKLHLPCPAAIGARGMARGQRENGVMANQAFIY